MACEIREAVVRGHKNKVLSHLRRSLAQCLSYYDKVRVGITVDPEARCKQYGPDWEVMLIKYVTSSLSYVRDVERILVEEYKDFLDNVAGGGGGPLPENAPKFYLYFICG